MMKQRPALTAAALAVALLVASGTEVRAAFQDFNYTATVAAGANPPGTVGSFGNTATVSQGAVTINLNAATENGLNAPTNIVFGGISSVDTTGLANNTTQAVDLNYDFRLTFTSDPTGAAQTQVVDIVGNLSGTISKSSSGSTSFMLTNTFMPSTLGIPVSFGAGTLTLTSGSFTPGAGTAVFGATVGLGGGGGGGTAVPEPASLTLLGLGVLGTFGLLRRRRPANVA